MKRILITGANGAGKTHMARQMQDARPDVPVFCFDAVKLTTGWQTRPRDQIDAALTDITSQPAWILEGGPSMLPLALPHADAVIWLDPPMSLRAWRLIRRAMAARRQTRPELPDGNPDHRGAQLAFAWRSLRRDRAFHHAISDAVQGA